MWVVAFGNGNALWSNRYIDRGLIPVTYTAEAVTTTLKIAYFSRICYFFFLALAMHWHQCSKHWKVGTPTICIKMMLQIIFRSTNIHATSWWRCTGGLDAHSYVAKISVAGTAMCTNKTKNRLGKYISRNIYGTVKGNDHSLVVFTWNYLHVYQDQEILQNWSRTLCLIRHINMRTLCEIR